MTLTPEEKAWVLAMLDEYQPSVFDRVYDLTKLMAYGIGYGVERTVSSLLSGSGNIEAQKQAAIALIRQGQESGVDEIEIIMSQKAGLSLGSNVNGIPIEATVGLSGNMKIRVKYK